MSRQPRDRDAEQTTIRAAIDRLLAGTRFVPAPANSPAPS